MTTEQAVETPKNKNIMPEPRQCPVTGEMVTKYSDLVWLPVFDKETKEWKDRPTHLSKKGAWILSKSSPTHPNNKTQTTEVTPAVNPELIMDNSEEVAPL